MDTEHFVELTQKYVVDVAVETTLSNLIDPPGRRIEAHERARSGCFKSLREDHKQFVEELIREGAESSIFHLFAVLDRSRKLADEDRFDLHYIKAGQATLINDFQGVGLNEIFNGGIDHLVSIPN